MAIKKHKLGDGILTLGETASGKEFAGQVTKVSLEPSYSEGDIVVVLSGDTDTEEAEWEGNLTGEFFQDYDAEGLLAWTWENDGQLVPFTFVPSKAGALQWTGEVKVRPVNVGGDVDVENRAEFEWALPAKPTMGAYTAA